MKEVKCEHCQRWTNGDNTHCAYCGGRFQEVYHKEREELAKQDFSLPLIKIKPDDPWLKRQANQMIRIGQLIFFTIISMIAAMASSTVH